MPSGSQPSVARDIGRQCLAMRARRLSRLVTRLYDDALRPHGLRVTQLNLLVGIAVAGPVRAAWLEDALDLERSTLSRNLDRMLRRGWIKAIPAARGRSKDLVATSTGLELLEAIRPAWQDAQRQVEQLIGNDATRALAGLDEHLA